MPSRELKYLDLSDTALISMFISVIKFTYGKGTKKADGKIKFRLV